MLLPLQRAPASCALYDLYLRLSRCRDLSLRGTRGFGCRLEGNLVDVTNGVPWKRDSRLFPDIHIPNVFDDFSIRYASEVINDCLRPRP